MSKVKDMFMKQLESEIEFELSYQEWLRDSFVKPSNDELDDMEQDCIAQTCFQETSNIIIHKPLNNSNYQPLQGA
jgi:hypothetical protein